MPAVNRKEPLTAVSNHPQSLVVVVVRSDHHFEHDDQHEHEALNLVMIKMNSFYHEDRNVK